MVGGIEKKGCGAEFSAFFDDPFEFSHAHVGDGECDGGGGRLFLMDSEDFESGLPLFDGGDFGCGERGAAVEQLHFFARANAHDVSEVVKFLPFERKAVAWMEFGVEIESFSWHWGDSKWNRGGKAPV